MHFRALPELEGRDQARREGGSFPATPQNEPHKHHDALEFADGQIVLVTRLCEGQRVKVLQLPAMPRLVNAAHAQRRDSIVN